ncbi:MAG: methyltransferase domain-containing protein [Microthrixaceae bacterium]|nr:methyltransferase domain-containing protein [Microthrixaceae bacterium]
MANQDQADYWNRRSISWDEEATKAEPVIGPFGQMAMEALRLRVGERVLDIGCGTGVTTRMLADALHPSGHAHGVDISSAMIDIARERVFHGGASFEVADAQVAAVEGAPFDAAFSRFGVMFFSDPEAAFANIRRSLLPGGRLGFACWQDLSLNDWIGLPATAVYGLLPEGTAPAPVAGEPGPFSMADAEGIYEMLQGAGYSLVRVEPIEHSVELPVELVDAVVEFGCGSGLVRDALRDASPDVVERAVGAIREAIEDCVVEIEPEPAAEGEEPGPPARVLRLSAAAHIVTARA